MLTSVEVIIDELMDREGPYVNHPADRGGPTCWGITQRTLSEYRGRPVTEQDVRHLSRTEAANIYRNQYLTSHQLHRINDPYVMVLAFDCSVNHGPHRAIRWLQQIAGVIDDGILGPATEVAVNTYEPVRLYQKLLAKRIRFYGSLVSNDPELKRAREAGFNLQAEFAAGWSNRAAEFVEG